MYCRLCVYSRRQGRGARVKRECIRESGGGRGGTIFLPPFPLFSRLLLIYALIIILQSAWRRRSNKYSQRRRERKNKETEAPKISLKEKLTTAKFKISHPGLRKVYPYYFTFTTFTKGRWVGEKILEVFGREFRAHPVEEYVSF